MSEPEAGSDASPSRGEDISRAQVCPACGRDSAKTHECHIVELLTQLVQIVGTIPVAEHGLLADVLRALWQTTQGVVATNAAILHEPQTAAEVAIEDAATWPGNFGVVGG